MRRSILFLACALISTSAGLRLTARGALETAACPAPTIARGSQCVLEGDTVLSQTLWLPSGATLNCQGRTLRPAHTGTLDDPRTTANEFSPSQPDLALFVHAADDVRIQNCHIEGFDFGIIVARSKALGRVTQPRIGIQGNTIDVRTNAIDIIKSDGVLITDNLLTYASERGRGVVLDYDSDDNRIVRNRIVSTDAASTGQVRQLPGGPFVVTQTAIMDNEIHILQADKPLQNFVVSGVLFQVVARNASDPDPADAVRPDDNLVEDNDILDLGVGASCTLDPATACQTNAQCGAGKGTCLLKQNSGIAFNNSAGATMVRANRLSGRMDRGISFGGVTANMTIPGSIVGVCRLDRSRLCSTDADCNIPGYDLISVGVCEDSLPETFNGNSVRLSAEGNSLSGVFDTAAFFANNANGFVFRGNTITGGTAGIRLNALAINGLVEHNVVSGGRDALYVGFHAPWSHVVRLNDFTDYVVGIRTSNDFVFPTEISEGGLGNYWGLSCPGFDPGFVRFENGAINPNVYDGSPFGRPIALRPGHHSSICR